MESVENPNLEVFHGPGPLPTEVEENIIDQCAGDLSTLRHCALTCRAWLPRSRFHLLPDIRISNQKDIYSFYDLFDTYPNLRTLVRSITVAPCVAEKRPACLVGTFPIPLFARLPNLRKWVLRNGPSGPSPSKSNLLKAAYHATTLRQLRTSSPITDLHLQGLSFVSRYEFLRFIASFTGLKHLKCDTIDFDRPDSLDPGRPKPRDLSKLRLSTLLMPHISQDVLRALLPGTVSTLERLHIPLEPCSGSQGVDGVLLSQMSRLHSLTFGIGLIHRDARGDFDSADLDCWATMAKALDGAHIPRIKSLSVHLPEPYRLPDYPTAQSLVSTILRMKIQSLTIEFRPFKSLVPSDPGWFRPFESLVPSDPGWAALMTMICQLLKAFTKLCEENLPLDVVVSNIDATFRHEIFDGKCTTMSPNGRWVATSISPGSGVVLWDLMSNNPSVHTFPFPSFFPSSTGNILHVIFSPDGERLLVVSDGGAAYVWDVKRRYLLTTITCDAVAGAWSPHYIVLITRDGTISTYDSSTYRPTNVHTLGDAGHYSIWSSARCPPCPSLLFSPDYRWMAAPYPTERSGYVWTIWMVGEEGNLMRHKVLSNPAGIFQTGCEAYYGGQIAFSSDGARMAVLTLDLELHVWDVGTATLLVNIDLTVSDAAQGLRRLNVSFSPNSQHLLVMGDKKAMIEVWDVAAGYVLDRLVLEGHSSDYAGWLRFMTPSFSPCGRYVISSYFNVRGPLVWKTEDGSMVCGNY